MDTLDFLRRVLPSDGKLCLGVAFQDEGGFRQRFFDTVEELATNATAFSDHDNDVYYGLASFGASGGRKQDNVHRIKVVALDIDVGKPRDAYPNRADAITALADFIDRAKLPIPVIVSSGAGFHCYWVLTRELTRDEWQPIADAVKRCWQSYGLICDPTVTSDAARVLRPVGTKHLKSGKTVALVRDAPDVAPEDLFAAVAPYASAQMAPAHVANRKVTLIDNLNTKTEFPPAVAFVVASKCKQIGEAIKDQGQVTEPLWYSLLGIAAYTTDPEATAKLWSKDHPQYNETATLDKLAQWKANATGPATCARFEAANPKGCHGCVFKGKITTPAALGRAFSEAPVDVSAPDPVSNEIRLPRPFKRTADGIKITIEDTDIDVCPFDLYPVGYGRDEVLGYETVRYHWNRPHKGWTLLSFRQALLTDGHRDFATVMADEGIVLASAKQTEFFRVMLRTYMEELKRNRAMSNLYASMGWKENNTQFVMGESVIRHDTSGQVIEEVTALSRQASKNANDLYGTKGTLQDWVDGTETLQTMDAPWHVFALNMGFAAPLFAFTGLKGLTVSLYGPTGGGKTLIQYWIQSIYGDPDKLHFAAKFTQNTLFSRLGLYSNLPMTIDEATMFEDKDIGDFLYWVSQGRDKARLNRSAEEREAKTWATPVIVSTNVSLQSKLISSGGETDAQAARLLEVNVPSHKLFRKNSRGGQLIYAHLMSNYGHAGREYVKELVRIGENNLRLMIEEARKTFSARYNAQFAGEERYWEMAIVLQDLGASIAHRLGLIKYDYTQGTRWVLEQLGVLRSAVAENRVDAFDLISEYLNHVADCAATIMHTDHAKPVCDMTRLPRGKILARFEVSRKKYDQPFDAGMLYINRDDFRRWLSLRQHDYKSLVAELLAAGMEGADKTRRVTMGKDTPSKVGVAYVLALDLTHPRLRPMLNEAEGAAERMAMTKLTLAVDNDIGDKT